MRFRGMEMPLHLDDGIKTFFDSWTASNVDNEASRPQEFTDLRNEFAAILSTRKQECLNRAVLDEILQQAETQRVATSCAKRLERRNEMLFVQLCQRLGRIRSQQLLDGSRGLSEIGVDSISSTNESQSTPEQITDGFECTGESPELIERGKATWNGLSPTHFSGISTSKIKPCQLTQNNSLPDEVGSADKSGGEPHERRVHLCTEGQGSKTARPTKRRRKLALQDTESEPDELCSADPAEATVPCTDDDSEASDEF
ncbi:hypothetical protein FBULB1_1446 [Fusarium bulbicola]|nr:hypothetical protein FBULB1_1446 [Fusarium bulbicola]